MKFKKIAKERREIQRESLDRRCERREMRKEKKIRRAFFCY